MLHLLLVDDETHTREGILESLDWESLGIEQIQTANNGVSALQICQNYTPHILLTDVKMPKMNGIELSRQVKKLLPTCSIIFMSGYSDRDFLKSAIEVSALHYIDKPIEQEELQASIAKAVAQQLALKKQQKLLSSSRSLVKNSLALMLTTPREDLSSFRESLYGFDPNISLDTPCTTIIVRVCSTHRHIFSNTSPLDSFLMEYNYSYILGHEGDDMVVHLLHERPSTSFLQMLYTRLIDFWETNQLFIGVGKTVLTLLEAYISYQTACETMERIFFDPSTKIYTFSSSAEPDSFAADPSMVSDFAHMIQNGQKERAVCYIQSLTNKFVHRPISRKGAIDLYFKLILVLYKNDDAFSESPHYDFIWESMDRFSFIDQMEEYLLERIEEYFDKIYAANAHRPIDSVLAIIHSQYADPKLSLQEVSRQTFLSSSYICVLCRDELGKPLTKYLAEYRVEKSLSYLKNKNCKLHDVATRVGFHDANYFSKIFKKIKGITPSEYRERFVKG